ncbi:DNA repair protein SWI5 homolog, partial [Sorex araneus]|uniref:DNA repair protein SWI5 homolog n=1 Tax=Sorex araneus TaxID=42254 RepID=UPI002433ECF9
STSGRGSLATSRDFRASAKIAPQPTESPRERARRGGTTRFIGRARGHGPPSLIPLARGNPALPEVLVGPSIVNVTPCWLRAQRPARRWAGPDGGAERSEPLPAARPGERRSGVRGHSRVPTLDPPALHSPPRWGLRSPRPQGARPGLSRRGRGAFRSPRPSPQAAQAGVGSRGSLCLDVERLRAERDALEREIAGLLSDGICVEELDEHISRLHEYNDLKDVGQMLLGKLAVLRGVTTKELYAEFDLDLND